MSVEMTTEMEQAREHMPALLGKLESRIKAELKP
jgi:hypothetical protein